VETAPSDFRPSALPTQGPLALSEVPVLFEALTARLATGCLHLRQGKIRKILFLREGEIVFALSNQVRETLGRYLVEHRKISEETYRVGLEAMRQQGKKFGQFLVESHCLPAEEVSRGVRENVLEKVLEVFSWREGEFLLSPYAEPPAALPGGRLDARGVLWEGVRERFPYDSLVAALTRHADSYFVPQRDLAARLAELYAASAHEVRVLAECGPRTLKTLMAELEPEGGLRLLYFALVCGCAALSAKAVGAQAEESPSEWIGRAKRQLDALSSRNSFQILEVSLGATDDEVRQAYLRRAREFHPDVLGTSAPSELQRTYAQLFQLVQNAQEDLRDDPARKAYLTSLQEGAEGESVGPTRILEAEIAFQEGRAHERKKAWERAAESFRKAFDLNPEQGEYTLHLGIARLREAAAGRPQLYRQAEELLERAAARCPTSPDPMYRLGRLYLETGDPQAAVRAYREALRRRPDHVGSQRELRLLQLRGQGAG
jgi:curved DNA-binding protein CbpA